MGMTRNELRHMKKMINTPKKDKMMRNPQMNKMNPNAMPNNFMSFPDIKCVKCECEKFLQVFNLKHMSALASPQGKEGVIHIGNFVCSDCGYMFNPQEYAQKEKEKLEQKLIVNE